MSALDDGAEVPASGEVGSDGLGAGSVTEPDPEPEPEDISLREALLLPSFTLSMYHTLFYVLVVSLPFQSHL